MITRKRVADIIDAAVTYGARRTSGVEVSVTDSDEFTARFANSGMTQHVQSGGASVSIRVLTAGRQARVTTDDTTLRGIHRAVDRAAELAKQLPVDKLLLPLSAPGPRTQLIVPLRRFDSRVPELALDARETAVKSIIKIASANRLSAAGIYSVSHELAAYGNSKGIFHFDRTSDVECSITMTGRNSSGWAKRNGFSLDMVDPKELAEIAAGKAVASKSPQPVRPGLWTVILEPSAVLDLLSFVWGEFTGTAHVDRTSSFTDQIGEKVLGDNITISDDVYHQLQAGYTFDDEGLARKAVTLVKNGVIGKPVMGRRTAKALKFAPTGHGVSQPSSFDEEAVNIVVAGGDASADDMIASTERGILLTRVWYVRDVDPNTNLLTGMTRDGTFLIDGGRIKHGIRNMRFNISVLEMLNNVEQLGQAVFASGEEGSPAVVPPMKVRNFRFSSRTKF
ncbi:MAG TPA: TldD/PmbA family protein [Planktothrix sp.]|jgi:predicted Zn-dependent protease